MKYHQPFYIEPRKGARHIDLCGTWEYAFLDEVSSPDSIDWKYRTAVPSSTYRSLMHSGILPDPYVGTNSALYRWVDEKVWYYRRKFSLSLDGQKAYLCFDGVSYYCRVWVNGTLLCEHDGMFAGPVVEVTSLLKDGENELIVEVKAANFGIKENFKPFNTDGEQTFLVPWNLIRDSVTSNGEFIAFGILRGVRIELLEPCHLSRPYLVTEEISDGKAKLHLSCEIIPEKLGELSGYDPEPYHEEYKPYFDSLKGLILSPLGEHADIRIRFFDGDNVCYDETVDFSLYERRGYDTKKEHFPDVNFFEHDIVLPDPVLWYPVGLGEAHLYRVKIELYRGGRLSDTQEFDFGVRIIRREFTAGKRFSRRFEKFLFSVNGRKFFLRGMNRTPTDFLLDCTEEDYRWELEAARDAGIQLMRVWSGGGIPESDVFYSLCDRYGIMVWQDHAIANMVTPRWDKRVLEEQESLTLYRIRNHPSLVLHCGGNEFNAYDDKNAESMCIIERSIHDLDPYREYVRSSPDGGSSHVYRDMEPVWYRKIYSDLPFLAESGIHCFPSEATLRLLISEKEADLPLNDIFSEDFRKTHPEFLAHFSEFSAERIPRMLSRASHITDIRSMALADICEATQMASYEFYQIMVEAMRENYPVCGGIMPWVFKRPWPTAAIQLMDGFGEALAPYYAVANAYRPIVVSQKLCEVTYAPGERLPLVSTLINASAGKTCGHVRVRIFSPSLEILLDKSAPVSALPDEKKEFFFGDFLIPETLSDTQFFLYVTYTESGKDTVLSRKFYPLSCLSKMRDDSVREAFRAEAKPNLSFEDGPYLRDEWQSAPRASLSFSLSVSDTLRDGDFVCGKLTVKNNSALPAYPVHFVPDRNEVKTCFEDAYFLLDAHEERTLGFRLKNVGEKPCRLRAVAWNCDEAWVTVE